LHDRYFAFVSIENYGARSGSASGIISRPQQSWFRREIVNDFRLIPNVVTSGDNRGSCTQQVDRDLRRDATACGGVFAIDDRKVDVLGFFDLREK